MARKTTSGKYLILHYRLFQKKSLHSWETKTSGTSYSETTNLLSVEIRQQGVLMRTPCSQSLRATRLVVFEYKVPQVLDSQECRSF